MSAAGDGQEGRSGELASFRPESERQVTHHLGMLVFLGSWAMMFAALFFSYGLLRVRAAAWPPPGAPALPLGVPGLACLVILASSATMAAATWASRRRRAAGVKQALIATLVLGAVFLALQAVTWRELWAGGFRPQDGAYASVFYLMTVFHALHVVVGFGLLASLLPAAFRRPLVPRTQGSLHVVGLFWHFVDVAWLLIYLIVYLP